MRALAGLKVPYRAAGWPVGGLGPRASDTASKQPTMVTMGALTYGARDSRTKDALNPSAHRLKGVNVTAICVVVLCPAPRVTERGEIRMTPDGRGTERFS